MSAFSRSMAMAAAIAAIMANSQLSFQDQQRAMMEIGPYESRGKGGRKTPRTFSGVARARREAKRLRNSKK